MASKVATAYLELRADSGTMLKDIDAAFGSAKKSVSAAGGKLGALFSSEFGQKLKGISAGITAALSAVAVAGAGIGLRMAAEAEQAQAAFETLIGSADRARAVLADIRKFAAETPFEQPELIAAGRSLLAFGTNAEDVVPTLRRLGDVASGIGQPLGEIAEIYGKARVQGRLFAEDINQLTGRGIPIIQELAKQFGVADSEVRKLVESGQVNFGHLEKAFVSLTAEGGKFSGMMQKQSATLTGVWSTFKDNLAITLQGIATPLVEPMKEMLNYAAGLVEKLGPVIQRLADWGAANKEFVVTIAAITAAGGALVVALAPIITAIAGMTTALAAAAPVVALVTANLGLLAAAAAPLAIAAIVTQTWRWVTMQNQLNAALREGVELREKLAQSDQNRTQKTIDESLKITDPAERQKFLDDAIKGEKTNLETYKRQVAAGQKQLKALYASNAVEGQSPEAIYMNNRKIAEIKAGEYGDALRKYETTKESIAALEKAKSAPVASATPAIPAPAAQTPSDKKSDRPQNPLSKFFTGLDQQAKNAPVDALKGKLSAIGSLPSVFGQIVEAISEPMKKEVQKQPSGTNQKVLQARTVDSAPVAPKFLGVAELSRNIQERLTGRDSRKDELQVQKKALAAMEKVVENTKEIAAKTKKKNVFKDS